MDNDIRSRADIDALMRRFYEQAMHDDVIGHFFTEVVKLDLDRHLPIIGDFWESALFGAGVYSRHGRNPLMIHADMNRKRALEPHHFDRWLELFERSVDERFAGPRADFAKVRSRAIARRFMEFLSQDK